MDNTSPTSWRWGIGRLATNPGWLICVCLVSLLCGTGLARASSNASNARSVELGVLKKIFEEVQGDPTLWVERFCEVALAQVGTDYARFVRLVQLESTPLTNEERRLQPQGSRSFSQYAQGHNRQRAFECLGHGGEVATAEVQYALYFIEGKRAGWLKKAASNGLADAQIDLAMLIYLARRNTDPKNEAGEEISPDRFRYWIRKASDSGHPRGMYEMAKLHLGHYGGEPWTGLNVVNAPAAIALLEKVAAETNEQSMRARTFNKGKTVITPELVPSNPLIRSLAAGYLGSLHYSGTFIRQDYSLALKWFSEVDEVYIWHCRAPLAWVRTALVHMYTNGLGIAKDPEKVRYYTQYGALGC